MRGLLESALSPGDRSLDAGDVVGCSLFVLVALATLRLAFSLNMTLPQKRRTKKNIRSSLSPGHVALRSPSLFLSPHGLGPNICKAGAQPAKCARVNNSTVCRGNEKRSMARFRRRRRCALTADCDCRVFARVPAHRETRATSQKRQAGVHFHHVLAGPVPWPLAASTPSSRRRLRGSRGPGGEVASTPNKWGACRTSAEAEDGERGRAGHVTLPTIALPCPAHRRLDRTNTSEHHPLCPCVLQATFVGRITTYPSHPIAASRLSTTPVSI